MQVRSLVRLKPMTSRPSTSDAVHHPPRCSWGTEVSLLPVKHWPFSPFTPSSHLQPPFTQSLTTAEEKPKPQTSPTLSFHGNKSAAGPPSPADAAFRAEHPGDAKGGRKQSPPCHRPVEKPPQISSALCCGQGCACCSADVSPHRSTPHRRCVRAVLPARAVGELPQD